MPVYAYCQPPRWLCRVGDFRSIEEADAAMRRLKATGVFKEVSIVREQINIQMCIRDRLDRMCYPLERKRANYFRRDQKASASTG